jgi:hypothetical protein
VGDGRAGKPDTDFLPQRSETLRESFQEKMRRRAGQRSSKAASQGGQFRLVEISHGPHPEAEALHDDFPPGCLKLKITLDILDVPLFAEGIPPAAVPLIGEAFPGLLRHRCCGGNDVLTTLFRRKARAGCALAPEETGTDLCHLLEHLSLELIAAISASSRCSGVTCGHRSPPHRYDLFLECEDPRVGMAAVRCAAHVLHSILVDGEAPAGTARYAETARYFMGRPRSVLGPGDVLADLQGDPNRLAESLRFLARAGFLTEDRFSFDFSGSMLYRYRLAPAPPAAAENIFL